ncbi:GNAT family N-acetyltransferase [Solibacillus sp. FSL K6-4121]|uniref:GNAT family N-acetyltransferase n=1 Tax=Solibacillus sp. FSL K6-4121 TaxID=2921505 RepID=UPI0030F6310D
MQIAFANTIQIPEVVSFFNENLDSNNSAVYSQEFLCPHGIKAAIRRKQMIVATVNGQLVGAFRFYRKKTQNNISLYQFAVSEIYRGQGLFKKMLETINDLPIISLCPTNSNLNNYYVKSGWYLQEQSGEFNVWVFNN